MIGWRKEFDIVDRETPKSLIERHAVAAACEPGTRSSRTTVAELVAAGKPVPDHMLPGRYIMRLPEDERWLLSQLKAEDTTGPGLWWANTWKPTPEPRTLSEYVAKYCGGVNANKTQRH